jgi:hypothetical protein
MVTATTITKSRINRFGGAQPTAGIVNTKMISDALAIFENSVGTRIPANEDWPTTADFYVSSSGNNGNSGSSGSPWATIAHALSQMSAGQSVMVLNNLTENLAAGSLTAGSSGNFKRVIAQTPGTTITGTFSSTGGANKYLSFEGLHWLHGTTEHDCSGVQQLKFIRCGFQGGPTSGNTVTQLAGSNQLYESCYWLTPGGRYASLCFEEVNVLYRWCIVRTDNWGSPADDGNPSAGIQIYSSDDCARIQCVALECVNQRSNNEFLAAFPTTTNTSSSTNILDQECFVVDMGSLIGFQIEGSNSVTYQGLGNVSVDNEYGLVENLDSSAGTVTITGGEYSNNNEDGIARFGVETVTVSNLNTVGNGSQNLRGTTNGGGNTTNALNMNTIVTNMLRRGVPGTMYGETGWNTQHGSITMFPLAVESLAKTKYNGFNARGWSNGSNSLTDYMKAVT